MRGLLNKLFECSYAFNKVINLCGYTYICKFIRKINVFICIHKTIKEIKAIYVYINKKKFT